jgi:uncharacterized protein with FMN-binding domain
LSFKSHDVTTLAPPPAAISSASPSQTTSGAGSSAAGGSSSNSGSTSTTVTPTGGTTTVTGSAVQTRYGPVEVQITITGGHVTAAEAIEYPTQSGRDRSINARAIPELNQEVLTAQSAKIDTVSGATYTSTGYITSLQSALDKAGLA